MRSLPVGAVLAAIVMFALGFVFFGLLGTMLHTPLEPASSAAVQGALGQQLSATGSYMVPGEEEAWMAGPSAVVNFVAAGDAPTMAMAMGMGFVHFLLSALLIGYGLMAVGGDAKRRMRVAIWFGLAAAVFMHLGNPIWYGFGWRSTMIEFAFDAIMFIAGGLILACWFTAPREAGGA